MSILQIAVTSADHIQGDPHAHVTLVEYGDYECPACGLAYPIVKALQKHFGKRLRFVFRNFPLTQIHPRLKTRLRRLNSRVRMTTTSGKCMTVSTRTRTRWDWPSTWLSQKTWTYPRRL